MQVLDSMAFAFVGRTFVVVHRPQAPTDAEWDAALAQIEARAATRWLVIAGSASPSAKQRKSAGTYFEAHPDARLALVTASPLARGAVTAIAWMLSRGGRFRTFGTDDLDGALAFLELPRPMADEVRERVRALHHALGLGAA